VDRTLEPDADGGGGFWRRYGLAVYWLLFALYSADAARYSGLVAHRQSASYPWVGLVATWVDLALEVMLLRWILRPRTFERSWGRLVVALAVYAVLAVLSAGTFVTDMPGYYYVPGQFHVVTFVGLFVVALVMAARSSRAEPS
jgi:O-antigen ligase